MNQIPQKLTDCEIEEYYKLSKYASSSLETKKKIFQKELQHPIQTLEILLEYKRRGIMYENTKYITEKHINYLKYLLDSSYQNSLLIPSLIDKIDKLTNLVDILEKRGKS